MSTLAEVTTLFNDTGVAVRERDGREVRRWQGEPITPRADFPLVTPAMFARSIAAVAGKPNGVQAQIRAAVGEPLPDAPFVAGSSTSHDAAVRADSTAETQRARVLAYIVAKGSAGATDDEGEVALDLCSQSYCPRRRELEKSGAIFRTSLRRETRTGSQAFAYCVRQTSQQAELI